ncbi:hypothetical protein C1646_767229 [Rhizophagus diaphanus]|nr:hypothetical protein C1646_767229 [Rhizophagus diaphanus] [Rhizophagus sp. MUCL 43196]
MYEAGMTKEHAKKILDVIDDNKFLIRVKFVRDNSSYDRRHNYAFKIVDKYQPIRESKRVGKKFVPEGPNVILTKKTKPSFWVEIDEKFLVKIIQSEKQSEYIELDANAVVYELYQIQKPDSKRLIFIKDGTLNCEKKMRQPDTWVKNVAELEKILKRPIKLLDITHGTIFNSGKYQTGRFEEIEMKVINKTLQGLQAIWLIGLGLEERETLEEIQSISQFVLENDRIINEERKQKFLELLKIVELTEQVFDANYAGGKLANEINDWHPTPAKCYPASMRNQRECSPWFKQFGHPTHHLVQVAVEGELPPDNITGFVQQTKVWLPKNWDISCAIIGKFTQGNKNEE